MIDLLIGIAIGACCVAAFHHFKGDVALKATPALDLETVLEGARHLMSQVADDLAAKISALPAELEAKFAPQITDLQATVTDLQGQLDTEKADHAADLQKLSDAVTAITPAG